MKIPSAFRSIAMLSMMSVGPAATAQEMGGLRLLVDPGGAYWFIVDHASRMQQREVELPAGPHHFTFWAPERRIVDTALTVEAGRLKDVVVRLPYSAEYLAYQRELSDHQGYMRRNRLLPGAITVGSLLYTALAWSKYKKAHDVLGQDKMDYDHSQSSELIDIMKDDRIPAHKKDFERAQRNFSIAAGVSILSAGITTWLYVRSSKRQAPMFQDQEKLRFDGLVWMPGPGGGQWMAGLTLDLSKR